MKPFCYSSEDEAPKRATIRPNARSTLSTMKKFGA